MNLFYASIVHLMITISILAMVLLMFIFISRGSNIIEKSYRILALWCAILIFSGAKIAGIGIPEFMLLAIDPTGGNGTKIILFVLPAISGTVITLFLFKSLKDNLNENVKIYFLILISTIIIMLFTDIYIGSYSDEHKGNLVINIGFIVGVILTLLFNIDILGNIYSYLDIENDSNCSDTNTNHQETNSWINKYRKNEEGE